MNAIRSSTASNAVDTLPNFEIRTLFRNRVPISQSSFVVRALAADFSFD